MTLQLTRDSLPSQEVTRLHSAIQALAVGQVLPLVAPAGPARQEVLQHLKARFESFGVQTQLLNLDLENGGGWAGLQEWLENLLPQMASRANHLVQKHSYELYMALPQHRAQLTNYKPSLTELAGDKEKVRNYAMDRAYRSLHGLIELLDEWHAFSDPAAQWLVIGDNWNKASPLIARFLSELVRRRGQKLNLKLVLVSDPGSLQQSDLQTWFKPEQVAALVEIGQTWPPYQPAPGLTPQEATRQAQLLEAQVEADAFQTEQALPQLIRLWQASTDPRRAWLWHARATGYYNHKGLYEVVGYHADKVLPHFDELCGDDPNRRGGVINTLYFALVPLGRVEEAYRLVEAGLVRIDDPDKLVELYYMLAMLEARFLPKTNQAKAEEYLKRSLAEIERCRRPDHDKYFLHAFDLNGLALVRTRQGRPAEAVELCQEAIRLLDARLSPDEHRLHRSVLVYNIAQVYSNVGPFETGLEYFDRVIALDPEYSEYYNERGNLYVKLERFEEAYADYQRAIELSPPYPEVWTNLGQCCRMLDRPAEAVAAYTRALDLNPETVLAYNGRAEAYESLGETEAALADYSSSLALKPADPLILANRAVLYYGQGDLVTSLSDLNTAIKLAPTQAELYQNRAVALRDLGRHHEAGQDLESYLELNPQAHDRAEVQATLAELYSKPERA